ncbi:MAG: OmpH family outer membrane protein [Sedimentisphaerales bacterium]|nr:OmpH family outer membrane protein [Sedimentisphaerales bacterium]
MIMKKNSMVIIFVAVIAAALWCYQASEAQSSAGPIALKMGVVNVAEILMSCQENLDREKEGMEKQRKIAEELKKLVTEAEAIKQELQNALQPGSDQFKERRKEWFHKEAQLQALKEYEKESLTIESQVWTESLYQKLLDEIKGVARQEGLSLVLNKDETKLKGRKLQDMFNMILSRKVLYSAPTLDITAKVLESLDVAYAKSR